ncbi:MAG: flagellar filament capping protein FliD, partial [Planctomycetes bacterium]|nr:flagellar filament capping protein FliD [Planctomycetota bacterium]
NDTYRFTVVTGGTVGTTDGIQISYIDGSGENSGTITLNSGDTDVSKTVAEGLQIKFSEGTLVAGQTFTIDAFVPTLQEAANASVTFGSGNGALTIQSATNQVDGLIGGATLSLLGADSNKEVKLTIANDTDAAKNAVLDFVKSYNDLLQFIDDQVRYDAQTKQAGVLLGERSATTIEDDVRRVVSELVSGVNGQMNRLGALGITTDEQGRLEVNDVKLTDALTGRLTGVTFDDVRRLFALSGQSTNGGIQFVSGSTRTKASTTPYQVEISQVAEQASITATSALAASTVIDGTNDTLTITVDGKASSTITLAAGTYTRLALAQELQAKINANPDLTGRKVAVSLNSDRLVITSSTYGLASEVKIGSGTALTPLGFAGTESDKGQDVVGKFIVNGVDEPATGTGQFLVGSATNPNTADLQVRVTLAAGQLQAGAEANLTVTRGIASKLDAVLGRLLDPVTGRVKVINDGFQSQIDDIKESVTRQNEILESRRQSLLRRFTAMERAVSQLRGTSDFLSAQLVSTTRLRQQQG